MPHPNVNRLTKKRDFRFKHSLTAQLEQDAVDELSALSIILPIQTSFETANSNITLLQPIMKFFVFSAKKRNNN